MSGASTLAQRLSSLVSGVLSQTEAVRSRVRLLSATEVGNKVRIGNTYIENHGRLVLGDGVKIASSPVQSHLVVGKSGFVTIGANGNIDHGAAISSYAGISIGSSVSIGARVVIMDSDFHGTKGSGDARQAIAAEAIRIGDGVVIGDDAIVMRGADIGAGAVVAPRSVVVGRVEPGASVAGVPARPVRSGEQGAAVLSEDEILQRTQRAFEVTFNLTEPLLADAAFEQVKGWDSLGSLRLLVQLEQELGVVLPEGILAGAHTLGDLLERLTRASQK